MKNHHIKCPAPNQYTDISRSFYFVIFLLLCVSLLTLSCSKSVAQNVDDMQSSEIIEFSSDQLKQLLKEMDSAILENPSEHRGPHVSVRSIRDNQLFLIPSRDWTSGFLPGLLWYMYELTDDNYWLVEARNRTAYIARERINASTHDMGFKIYCSFGNGYRLTEDPYYRDVIIEASNTLITRYNETVGAIRSWDHNSDKWDFPVIIDNMMNLEMLFRASELTGDPVYNDIAIQHARTTIEQHFRDDFSTYHVIGFNPENGEVMQRHTHQGAFHESSWARGQAWGLYGFVMTYRFTELQEFLNQAEKIAEFMLDHPRLPSDLVPYWDYDAENIPNEPRDASAAAITASALYELSTMVPEKSDYYKQMADKMLASLYNNYRSAKGENFGFLLEHSTGHLPGDHEIDTPLIYADYYFIEAALRKLKIEGI